MKITGLSIEKFMALSEAKIKLSDRGLLLVQGENKDDPSANSNGAGKSSIPDALCWALFGTTARGITGDAVINTTAKKGTVVTVDVDDGGTVYRIKRHRKHKTGKNSLQVLKLADDGEITDLSKGTDKETQKVVEKIIGSSYDVFRAAVYAGQEDMPDLPGMTDKFLKTLIEEAAGINMLESAYTIARDRLNIAKRNLDDAESVVRRIVEKSDMAKDEKKRAETAAVDWKKSIAAEISGLKDEAKRCVEDAKDKAKLTTDKADIEAQVADIDKRLAAVKGEQDERDRLAEVVAACDRNLARASADADQRKSEAQKLKNKLASIDELVGTSCGECGKTYVKDDLADAKALADKNFKEAGKRYVEAKKAQEDASNRALEARTALSTFVDSMTDVSELVAAQRGYRDELKDIAEIESDIRSLKDRGRSLVAQIKKRSEEVNPHKSTIESIEKVLKTCADKHKSAVKEVDEVKAAVEIAEAAVEVYSPKGVRAIILDTVTPFLNDRTAHYLGALSDGNISATWSTLSTTAKGELREKFAINVTNDKGAKSFAGLSGGEKRKARLATSLALQDLIASRATKPIDLWMGDEVDDALDVSGLERLMTILEEKARERGTVLVISHNDLNDWISETVTVTKESGLSTISEGV